MGAVKSVKYAQIDLKTDDTNKKSIDCINATILYMNINSFAMAYHTEATVN